jgi:hypothetical protein
MSYQEVITLWAGLSVDLIIEQVLMTSMKTSDGLTRGHGMTDQQLVKWLLTMADCADVNHAILQLTGVNYNTGVQNKDMTDARQALDMKDTHIIRWSRGRMLDYESRVQGTVPSRRKTYVNICENVVVSNKRPSKSSFSPPPPPLSLPHPLSFPPPLSPQACQIDLSSVTTCIIIISNQKKKPVRVRRKANEGLQTPSP